MKIKRLLIGMLACSAMVACTNDDLLENPNDQPVNGADGKAYVSVKLVSSDSNGSRSTTNGGYETADPELEKKIDGSKSIFLFYEKDGRWVTSGVISTQTPNGTDANDPDRKDNVANDVEGEALIVLQGTESELARCEKVLTVINYSDCEGLKQLTLNQALAKIATTTADKADGTSNGFLMATSVYNNGTDIINYTAVSSANICATPESAKDAPVIIHVERAAAKVDVDVTETTSDLQLIGDKGIVVDGVITPVQITIDGWTLNGINESTNIVKQLETSWVISGTGDVPFASWNNATDYRSYWAKSTNYGGTETLTYKKYDQAGTAANGKAVEYCYENNVDNYVIDYNVVTKDHEVTTVLIKAHFNLLNTDANGAPTTTVADQTFYEFNGVYYTETNYKKLIAKQLKDAGYRVVTETQVTEGETTVTKIEAATIAESALTIVTDGTLAGIQFTVADATTGRYAMITVDANGEAVVGQNGVTITEGKDNLTATAIADYIKTLDYANEAEAYLNGQCYYQVPIEHLAAAEGVKTYEESEGTKTYKFVEGYYGVIRNHHYKLNISAIKNIGEPVYNDEVVIKDIPAKLVDYYMAAELHVLNWNLVNQDVEL